MTPNKLMLATISGGLAMWAIAGFWHLAAAARFYARETGAEHEGTGIILGAYLVLALLMAYLYPRGYRGGHPALEGLRFGAVIGILWVLPHGLVRAGAHGEPIGYEIINAAWHVVEQGLGGIVIGLIHGRHTPDT